MIPARDFRTDAALRPQPKRAGPDSWATPACLIRALIAAGVEVAVVPR